MNASHSNITPLRIFPPGEECMLDVIRRAHSAGLHLVSNGFRIYLTPILLPGEREIAVRIVPQPMPEAA